MDRLQADLGQARTCHWSEEYGDHGLQDKPRKSRSLRSEQYVAPFDKRQPAGERYFMSAIYAVIIKRTPPITRVLFAHHAYYITMGESTSIKRKIIERSLVGNFKESIQI
jgi:hypothetical protein